MLSDSKDGFDDAKPCMVVNDLLVENDLLDIVVNEYEISFTNALSLKVLVVI